ncbi:hypothetical protein TVAG_051740 [Trichomonas vaginalis G3]|uniref:Right handed beta helix domain-containing protein n=1 Tax=Trichomonas vaginalis (strain ATCC PRA-98 / G3) TaxID=412133 RepID=A2FVU2_TRIV3|nr:hypothetical protein TVAGG3_0756790 [Trichomonas vaginalis G3]EAX90973.1 hypothetical protein TVAG_051740 [Trichomonas vaginalis G3]KAI5512922.1 hypothetical protein TVAGG3_0756790 [Trichomonas vaginalis G3]|eukprot:XP_001303903.1 hypothetical protein [Trichomonas vaginalis G3]
MNTSNHVTTRCAAYGIQSPTETGIINFTTASNTSSTEQGGIFNSQNTINIIKCNYLYNSYTGSINGLILNSGTVTFSNCSFIRNKGNFLFSDKPYIIHCYFKDNDIKRISSDNNVYIDPGEPFDSYLSHYAMDKCPDTYLEQRSFEEEDKFLIEAIKFVAMGAYNTSFCEAMHLSSLI